MGSRDYIVTRAEREATGKTSVEIVRDRERQRRRNRPDPEPEAATPNAQLVLAGLSSTTPGFEQFSGDQAEKEAIQNYQDSLIPERERAAREEPRENKVFETVESQRADRTVSLMTPAAQERWDKMSLEDQQARVPLNQALYTVTPGTRLSPSSRFYTTRKSDDPKPASAYDLAPSISQFVFNKYKEGGYVDDDGRPLKMEQGKFNQLVADESRRRAMERGAERDLESGYISYAQYNRVITKTNFQRNQFAKREHREVDAFERAEARQRKAQFHETMSGYESKAERERNKSYEDKQFDLGYAAWKDYEELEKNWGKYQSDRFDTIATGNFNKNAEYFGREGGVPESYEERKKSVWKWPGLALDTAVTGVTLLPNFITFNFQKAVYESAIKFHSREADKKGSVKNEGYGLTDPLPAGDIPIRLPIFQSKIGTYKPPKWLAVGSTNPRYETYRKGWDPSTFEGGLRWTSIAVSTGILGHQLSVASKSVQAQPKGFTQTSQRQYFGQNTQKFYSIDPKHGFTPIAPNKILAAFKKGGAGIKLGIDPGRPLGMLRYGSQGTPGKAGFYSRGDFYNYQTGKSGSFITSRGFFGGEKRAFLIQGKPTGGNVNVAYHVSRTRGIIGTKVNYPAQTFTAKLPPIQTDAWSNQFSTYRSWPEYLKADGSSTIPNYLKSKGPQGYWRNVEQNVLAKNFGARITYPKNFWTKQVVNSRHELQIITRSTTVPSPQSITHPAYTQTMAWNPAPMKGAFIFNQKSNLMTLYKAPKISIGKMSSPIDYQTLFGSKQISATHGGYTFQSNSVAFKNVFDTRLFRGVRVGSSQAGYTTYTTASRIPDYIAAIKNKYYNIQHPQAQAPNIGILRMFKSKRASSGGVGGRSHGVTFPQYDINALTRVDTGLVSAPSMFREGSLIVPNYASPTSLISPTDLFSQAHVTPLPLLMAGGYTQPLVSSTPKATPISLTRVGALSLPLYDTGAFSFAGGGASTQPLVTPVAMTEPITGIRSPFRAGPRTTPIPGGGDTFLDIVINPIPPPPPPPGGGGLLGGLVVPFPFAQGGSGGRRRGKRYGLKYGPKYKPTLIAFDFKIKADKFFNPKKFVGLGVGVRPTL